MSFLDLVRNAGIVGAGGAGFPTHVKLNSSGPAGGIFKPEYLIANGAECEPLLRSDRRLMETKAAEIVRALLAAAEATGAANTVIATKRHYELAVAALTKAAAGTGISFHLMKSTYPSGDEQTLVYDITGRVVPTGGLPLDVGCVVCNAATLVNISAALDGEPVTGKVLTVTGAVKNPVTVEVPIGTPIASLIRAAGGFVSGAADDYEVIAGGPLMGFTVRSLDEPVTKTTGGIIPLPKNHRILSYKNVDPSRQAKMARAVCCQCSLCTQLCPRAALGLGVSPHKAMRSLAAERGKLLGRVNTLFSCCDCGLCSYYACNFGLAPHVVMGNFKKALMAEGVKPKRETAGEADRGIANKKVPSARLLARLDLKRYDRDAPLVPFTEKVSRVRIPLKMHIGVPCKAVVENGAAVKKGALIAAAEGLGAPIHASIDGVVSAVSAEFIEIKAEMT
ncbi:MAG: SLBB domain-containing protein [Treponema sp.]|jgi:RnfABCDGE-type electron transport complex C subunit|nr:SLBB domain-containing protein [Treponema sp.]